MPPRVERRPQRFAGAESCLRVSIFVPNIHYERMCATEHAPRGSFCVLERPYGLAVYLTAGRGLIPRRGDWLPGTAWDMSDLAPLSVAERCEPAPEDATFTHVCG